MSSVVTAMCASRGSHDSLRRGAVVLAMGCRERTRGALNIPGTRPRAFTPPAAHSACATWKGYLPGTQGGHPRLGRHRPDHGAPHDAGRARRSSLACELMPYSSGLNRNIVQCLVDNDIPLKLQPHRDRHPRHASASTGVTISRGGSRNPRAHPRNRVVLYRMRHAASVGRPDSRKRADAARRASRWIPCTIGRGG